MLNRKNHVLVGRLKSEINESFNFVPCEQGGGGGVVIVWGCMADGARGPLMIYSGKLTGPAYIDVIEETLPMFIQNRFDANNNDWVYMHDNAPSHRAAYTKNWMKENKINLLIWSPSSPDLNPIENLWDHMDKHLRTLKPISVRQLQRTIEDIWLGVTAKKCQDLVNTIPRRTKQCILTGGGTFKKY